MKCKCGYEGLAEIGSFPDERFGGKYKDNQKWNMPFSCPKCKTNKNIQYTNCLDTIQNIIVNKLLPIHQFSFNFIEGESGIRVNTRRPNASGMSFMKPKEILELIKKYPTIRFENFGLKKEWLIEDELKKIVEEKINKIQNEM